MVPAWISSLSPDVLEAVLHHPPPAELGPAPRPAAREDVPEQVRDEQNAAALHVAAQVIKGHPPELERARVGRLERGFAFRGRLLLVLVEHVLVAPRELLFQFEAIADREAPPRLGTELVEAIRGLSRLRLDGEDNKETIRAASNYALSLTRLQRCEEAKSLLHRTVPVARRILGENGLLTLTVRWIYAAALYRDDGATLEDLREAVTRLEEVERTARRVLGGAHPITRGIEESLREARAHLRARETPPPSV